MGFQEYESTRVHKSMGTQKYGSAKEYKSMGAQEPKKYGSARIWEHTSMRTQEYGPTAVREYK